jgi:hypothetical protein
MTNTPNTIKLERWPEKTRKLPYGLIGVGYVVDPEDPHHIIPDPSAIVFIEQAFDFIDAGNSLREVSEWLSQKLSRPIVHQTISNLYARHRRPFLNRKTNRRVGRKKSREEIAIQVAKANVTKAAKKAKTVEEKYKDKKLKSEDYETPPEEKKRPNNFNPSSEYKVAPVPTDPLINFVFTPNEGPQTLFLSAPEQEVLYGGAAGGGKSYAMIADPMRYFDNGNFVGLLLRRTNDELRELKWETQKLYKKIWPDAKWSEQQSMWTFPSGAKFWITYLDRDDDVMRYQGQAFTWIGMDELTQYPTPFAYTYLKSRLRSADPELQKSLCMRATTNPGGPGHHWVKKMFIDPAPAGQSFWATDIETGEILRYPDDHSDLRLRGKPLFKRRFIPARLSDNPHLYNEGSYERGLLGLPEAQRRKLLDGDWSIVEGAAFAEFNPRIHTCEPFQIPNDWRRFRSADYGYTSPACVLWFAIDPSYETLYVYRELYKSKMTAVDMAREVLSLEANEKVSYGILDSSVWHDRGHFGPSIAEEMIGYGCRWRPSDRSAGSRVAGKNRLHELLKPRPIGFNEEKPGLVIFNTCRQLLTDLPAIPSDPDGGDDIDDRYPNDHSYDALRYGIMSRPRSGSALDWGSTPMNKYSPSDSTFGY